MSVNSALGSVAIIVDQIPHMFDNKLKGLKPGSDDAFYMLAAFCFNVSRKLEYFFLATKEFGQDADRAIALRLKRDRDELASAGTDWHSIAVKEEELMRRIYGEIKDDYEALWASKTGGGAH